MTKENRDQSVIAEFKKGKQKVALHAKRENVAWTYWLVNEDNGELKESPAVYSWDAATELLNQHPWTEMDMVKVASAFSDHIAELRDTTSNGGSSKKEKVNSQLRILQIFLRLLNKESVKLDQLMHEYGKHIETIKKDIEYIRLAIGSTQELKYDKVDKNYTLFFRDDFLTVGDTMVLLLMLYHSRVLNNDECQILVNKLTSFYSIEQQNKLKRFFRSYKYHYHPIQKDDLLQKIDTLFKAILEQRVLQFHYPKKGQLIKRKVIPYTIIFHDGMFYLAAHKIEIQNEKPVFWRLDRMCECKLLRDTFQHKENLDVGEYRMQSFNMFTGDLLKVKIKMKTKLKEYLDRESMKAQETQKLDEEWSVFEIEVRGTQGIILWLLQQKDEVEVLEPQQLRDEMKDIVKRMSNLYLKEKTVQS